MDNNNMPLVSIIVPCYNQAQYLAETLDSVLAQTYSNWECIIVNDGSPDNTEEIAKAYCVKDKKFIYISQDNAGVSMARNNGISISHGEYILPLDGDDLIAPTYLEKAISIFIKNPNTKLVYCEARKFGASMGILELNEYHYDQFIYYNCLFSSCLFRKADFLMTNGYNPNMKEGCEDWDFYLSLLHKDDLVYQIPEVLFYYRIHKKSRNTGACNRMDIILRKIALNHPDIYKDKTEELLFYAFNYRCLEQKVHSLIQSPYYRVGFWVLFPYRAILRIIRHFRNLKK